MYFVYILYSPKVDRLYIGVTNDIDRRLEQHNSGGSNYTRGKGPWYIVYKEEYENKSEALKREREIKNWKSRSRIIKEFKINLGDFNRQSGPGSE